MSSYFVVLLKRTRRQKIDDFFMSHIMKLYVEHKNEIKKSFVVLCFVCKMYHMDVSDSFRYKTGVNGPEI